MTKRKINDPMGHSRNDDTTKDPAPSDAAAAQSAPDATSSEDIQISEETTAGPADKEAAAGEKQEKAPSPEERIAELEDRLLREKANFANTQRRLANERADAVRFANVDLVRALLPVLDDFERSIEAGSQTNDAASLIEGTKLVYENLLKTLIGFGLEAIESKGQAFNPNYHEAMLQQPSADVEPNTVLQEITKGYVFKERLIRPSRVIVSKAPE